MPFLGKSPSEGNHNVLLDAITTSATATYNLTKDSVAYTPVSAQSLMVSLNGVTQAPIAAYTVSGSTIVFASALTSNDVIDYVIAFEGPRQTLSVDDIGAGTITSSMIADNAITSAKIGVDVIVAEDLAANSITVSELTDDAVTQAKIADDAVDEARLQISNSGTNGHALTYQSGNTGKLTWAAMSGGVSGITSSADGTAMTIDSSERIVMPYQPMFYATNLNAVSGGSLHTEGSYEYNSSGQTSGTIQAVGFEKIWLNIGSHWNTSTGVFTVPVAGRYIAYWNNNYHQAASNGYSSSYIMWNAKTVAQSWNSHSTGSTDTYSNLPAIAIIQAAVNDKIWPGYHSSYGAPTATATWGYHQCGIMLIG